MLRHGDCRPDRQARFVGQTDLPLNGVGRRQAAFWQRSLAAVPFQHFISSDLNRSAETARIIAGSREGEVRAIARLREINLGGWDGLLVDQVRRADPAAYASRGDDLAGFRPPAGDSFADLAGRIVPLFEEIVADLPGPLLLVGHAGVNRVILCHLLGLPLSQLFRLPQDSGALTLL